MTVTIEPEILDWASQEAHRRQESLSRFVGDLIRHARGGFSGRPSWGADEGEPLPDSLRPLFWEFDFDSLRWPADRDLVVAKILEVGDLSAFGWVRSTLGRDYLRSWLIARGGRGLEPRQISFWGVVLGIPEELTNRWLKALEGDPWANRLSS